ncbi:MAG TPA: PadR family transcriptional regulator [Anaerolineaceae bacterium]|nr:PadR family transcriptional regulator [Anaerolineaceae bacterium]
MKEHNLTNAELAILSLIAEQPRHGYELEQIIEERGMRDWTEVAFSSIYFILNGLVKKELADSILQPAAGRGPAKKVFTATPLGYQVLHDGIYLAISIADHDNQRFLLGLSCLPLLSQLEVEQAFQERMTSLTAKINVFSAHPAFTIPGFPPHVRAMFEYSIALIQTELDWSEKFLDSYMKGHSSNGKTGPQKTI